MNSEYAAFMQAMLTVEPIYELARILRGEPDRGLPDCLACHLRDVFEVAGKTPRGGVLWLFELLTAEWAIRKTLNSGYRLPKFLLNPYPQAVVRSLSKEAEKSAEVLASMWRCLISLFGNGRITQRPANLLYVLLKENPLSGLFPATAYGDDSTTAEVFIKKQQRINKFLISLDNECPIDQNLVATIYVLEAMRNFAETSDAFRRDYYRPFRESRARLIKYYERSRPVLLPLDKTRPIRSHMRGLFEK